MQWLSWQWTRNSWMAFSLYLLLASMGLRLGLHAFQHLALPAMVVCGLIGWWLNYRRYRLFADTPMARTASAALGHVELHGQAWCHPQAANISPFSGRRCIWYRCRRQSRRRGNELSQPIDGRSLLQEDCSDLTFILRDGDSEVVVYPEGAEVQTQRRESWQEGPDTLTEEWIAEGDMLYVVGELQREGGSMPDARSFHQDVSALLTSWKQDSQGLLSRFDLDGDGQLSEQEWLLVRAAAERAVRNDYQAMAAQPLALILRQPADGRPFLLNTRPARVAARSYRVRAWLHALAALLCLWAYLKMGLAR